MSPCVDFRSQIFSGSPELRYLEGPLNGTPLLLLHGVARDANDFALLIPDLLPHWHVYACDFRGHGSSGRDDGHYLVKDYARDTGEFVTKIFSEPAVLYGHSLGAMVAAAVAAEHPAAVRAIILEDPPFHTMGSRIRRTFYPILFRNMQTLAREGGSIEELTDRLSDVKLSDDAADGAQRLGDLRDRNSLRRSAECLARLDPEVFTPIIAGRWLDGYDPRTIFERIECPVLLLQADSAAGGVLTAEDVRLAETVLSECRSVHFPRASHLIHWEQPKEILRALEEFAKSFGLTNGPAQKQTTTPQLEHL